MSILRAALQKVEDDQVDTIGKAADPGKFKDERKWPDWEPAFVNYLSMIHGSYHVPLSYVVREQEDPDHNCNFGDNFVSEMIACAPLDGAHFRADSRHVHQLLKNFLVVDDGRAVDQELRTSYGRSSRYAHPTKTLLERAMQVGELQLPNG